MVWHESGLRTKGWTPEGGNGMYTKEQEEMALREYERLGSVAAVIQRLGYPSESTLYRWYERKKAELENRHGQIAETTATMDHHCNTLGHPSHPSEEFKYEVLRRGPQCCRRLVNLVPAHRAKLARKMEESRLTLLQIKILLFVLWHFDLDFSVFNSQFNFSPYRFIDRYILIDSFKTDS